MLFEESEESPGQKGLGFFEGRVVHFDRDSGLKIPHMGWNEVAPVDPDFYAWDGAPNPLYLYFVHSYFPSPTDSSLVASTTDYGESFASSVSTGNIFAGQFHPERSQEAGLNLIGNFLKKG